MYENFNLKAWPFQTVPDPDFAKIWAGRKQTKLQLDALLRKMQLVPKSSLYLLWANFGMGKTHTLLHIQHLCSQTKGVLIPVYAVMPNKPAAFLDVYREIVASLPFDYLGDQIIRVGSSSPGGVSLNPMFAKSPGVVNALLALRKGEIESTTAALQWLKAQPGLSGTDMRQIGVTYRIKTAEDAIHALSALTKLATYKVNPNARLVILIDEYQRIEELKPSVRNEINAGLHAYFNAHPTGLALMMSFSFGKKENVAFLLSNELKSRAEPEALNLDVLNPGQAAEFLSDLLAQFRLRSDDRWAFPFSPQAINALIQHISRKKALTPRRVMLYANHILTGRLVDYPEAITAISDKEVSASLEKLDAEELDLDNSGIDGG
jgi:hypothetical protein